MKCVNRSSKEFKVLADHHKVSIDKLELITHKYWIEKGSEEEFPSDAYIQVELGGLPYKESAKAVRDLWESRYKKPKEYKTKKGLQAAYDEAKRFFPEYAIVSYKNNEGNLTMVIRQPVAEIKTVKDYLNKPVSSTQKQQDYELITDNLVKELENNRNFANAKHLRNRLNKEKQLSKKLEVAISTIDNAIKAGQWDSEAINQLNNLVKDINDGRIQFKRFLYAAEEGFRRSGHILQAATLLFRGDGKTVGRESQNLSPTKRYERDKQAQPIQEKRLIEWAKAANVWFDSVSEATENMEHKKNLDGGEAQIFRKDGTTYRKLISTEYFITPQFALDRIALHNMLPMAAPLELVGFTQDEEGNLLFVVDQPFIKGSIPTEEEIKDLAKKIGFNKSNKDRGNTYISEDKSIYMSDLHDENVLKISKNHLVIIDADFRLNTPDLGRDGTYITDNSLQTTEKAFEEETPFDEIQMAIDSRKKPHPFTFKDGITINAPFLVNQQQENALNVMNDFIHSDETSMTLSGYAGTGKTSIMEILAKKMDKENRRIIFSATTNKAAEVLKSRVSNSGFDAYTLNKVFGISVDADTNSSYNAKNLVNVVRESQIISPGDIVVIDEASMINEENYKILNQVAKQNGLKIIYVGDKAQLPPVNESEISIVFRTKEGRVVELTQVERTDDNAILKEATDIRNGKRLSGESSFNDKGEGVAYIKNSNKKAVKDIINHFVPNLRSNPDYFRILAYHNAIVEQYNEDVRKALGYTGNTPRIGEPIVGYSNWGAEYNKRTRQTEYKFINSQSYKVVQVSNPTPISHDIGMTRITLEAVPIVLEDSEGKRQVINFIDIKGNEENKQKALILAKEKARLRNEASAYWKRGDKRGYGELKQKANDIEKFLFVNDDIVDEDVWVTQKGRRVHPTYQTKVFDFGYALTVHKSQGSTFTHVLLDDVDIQTARDTNAPQWNALAINDLEADYMDAADAEQTGEENELFSFDDAGDIQQTAINTAPVQNTEPTKTNIRQQLDYVGISRATDTVTVIANDNTVKSEDTPLNHIKKASVSEASPSENKPVEQMSSKEIWRYMSAMQPATKRSQVTYIPKGQEKQTYTVENGHIYNKEGKEVYPENTVHKTHRNKILANYAVQEGLAIVVKHPTTGEKYVVDNNGQITSVRTGDIMKWDEGHGDRRRILAQAEKEFRERIAATKERGNTFNEQLLDHLQLTGLDLHYEDEMAQYLRKHKNGMFSTENDDIQAIQTTEGEVRGFATPEGSLYLDRTAISPEHPIHEYTHLWDRVVAKNNPELWNRGISLMKQISLWKDIENDENYGKKWKSIENMTPKKLESLIASEVHSRLTGVNGEQILDKLSKEKEQKGIIGKLKQWLLDFWKDLKATFSNWSQEDLDKLTLQDFTMMTIKDFADGFNPNTFKQASRDNTINQIDNSSNNKIEYGNDFRRIQETVKRDSQGSSVAGRDIGHDARQRLAGVIGSQLRSFNGSLWGGSRDAVSSKGVHYNIHSDVNPQLFHDIFEVVRYYTQNGELVDLHDNYTNCKCYLSDDGTCGFAIEPSGNLVSVFNLGLSRGFLSAIKDMAIDEGATHLDAFASSQQNLRLMYEHTLGAKVASSMDYNMEYDKDDIAANHGNPQVVFMVMGEAAEGNIEEKHFNKDQYDEAQAYQKSFVPGASPSGEITLQQDTQPQPVDVSDTDSFDQDYEATEPEETHPMMTKKEQEEVNTKLDKYDELNIQIDNLKNSDFISDSEVRHAAEQIMNAVSDEVTRIQKEEGLAEKLFPSLKIDKEAFDFSKASRKEIIETIGLPRLLDRAKELFNTEIVDFDDLATEQQADVIYENFEGILFFGTDIFAMNEGFGIKKNYKTGAYESTNTIELSMDDQGNYQDPDGIREQEDEQEHWQIEQRTLDILSSATELVRMAIHDCYLKDKNGNNIRDKFGIYERVNPKEAVQKILKWTKGAQSLSEMVSRLEAKKDKNLWLEQLINRLNDKSGNESDLQSQFYGVMKKSRQSYNITQLENNKFIVKFVNNDISRRDLFNNIVAKYTMGEMLLFKGKHINKGALGTKDNVSEDADFSLHKAHAALKVIIDKLKRNEELTDELYDEIVNNLTGVNNIFGIYTSQEAVEEAITKDTVTDMTRYLGYIIDTLDKEVQIQNENPEKASSYTPLEFKSRNSIDGSLKNYLKPIADVLDETATNVVFEDGKMYQEFVTPSYMSLLMEKFHWGEKEFRKFIQEEYGKSEWFKFKGTDRNRGWRFGWLKKLAGDQDSRDIFDHTVELNFNKHRYMKTMTPAEYAVSVIAHYFAEKSDEKQTLVPAWFRVPIQSNKPSSEFIKFWSYRGNDYKDTIAEEMYNLFLQEISRIQTVNMRGLDKKNPDYIKNWDDKGKKFNFMPYLNAYLKDSKEAGNLLRDKDKDAKLAKMIQQLENRQKPENEAELIELVQEAIKNAMQDKVDTILENWEQSGIVEAAQKIQGIGTSEEEVRNNLENFLWNDNFASINILELTVGDIAAYKDSDDLQKRLAELHAPGIRANIYATDYKGNRVSDGVYRTFVLQDFDDFISNVIDNITEIFNRKIEAAADSEKAGLIALRDSLVRPRTYNEDGSVKDKGGKYWNINVADAQGYSSPTSYRKKAFMFGKWSPHSEEIYQKLLNGEYNYTDLETAFQPLKPFVYSQLHKEVGVKGDNISTDSPIQTMPMPFQAKNAEYLLIMADAIMRGAEKQGISTGKPNLLRAIYRVMEDSAYDGRTYDANGNIKNPGTYNGKGIDTVQFESAIKSGLQGRINIHQFRDVEGGEEAAYSFMMDQIYKWDDKGNRTNEYNTRTFVHETSFDGYCMQQEVPAHFENHHQAQGSQERMIIPSDLDMFTLDGKENYYEWTDSDGTHRKVRADEFKREYEQTIAANIEADLESLRNTFQLRGDKRQQNIALSEILQNEILDNPRYGIELFQACSVDKKTGEFRIPKGDPIQAKRIEQLINSIIKARVNKQTIAGGPIVQVSNFGTSTQLNIRFNHRNGGLLMTRKEYEGWQPVTHQTYEEYVKENQAGIAYFEVFAPMWMKDKIFKEFADKDGNIDIETIKAINPDLLKMISYRIPTEDKYSIAPMMVVGFLPKEAGDAIMFPYELTEIDDSDFDVDKRYVMRKDLKIINDVRRSDLQYALERKLIDSWEKAHKGQKINKKWVKDQIKMFLDNPQEMRTADRLMASLWKEYVKMAYTTEEPPSQKAINNNKMLDMTWAVLTNEMTADKILNPGGFDNFKDIGYQIAAYKNSNLSWEEIEKMSVDDRKKLAIPNKDLTWMDAQLHYYHQNTSGSNLIGVFAVNKVAHATLEGDGLQIAVNEICGEHPFTIAGFTFGDWMELDNARDTKGNLVGKTIGSGVSASADTAKEPTLDLININMTTAGVFNSMLRLGMPQREAALFMAQNVISDVLNEFNRLNLSGFASLDSIISKRIKKFESENTITEDSKILTEELTEQELISGLKPGDEQTDYKVLLAFNKLREIAKVVRKPTFATRFNSISSAVGPQIIDNIVLKHKMSQFRRLSDETGTHVYTRDGEEADITTVFDMHPILKAFAETVDIADTMFHDMPAGSTGFQEVIDALPDNLKEKMMNDKKLLSKLSDFYQSYLLVQSGLIDAGNLKRYIENFPKWFVEQKIQEKYPDNALIKDISMQVSKKTGRTFMNVDTVGKKESEKEIYRSAWTDLHKQDPKLSMMLMTYWFFRGGIGFSPKTSTNLISNYVKENFSIEKEGNKISYLDVYRHLSGINPELLIDQFIRNNWQESKLVPKKGGKGTHYNYSDIKNGILEIYAQEDMDDLRDIEWMRTTYNKQTYLWKQIGESDTGTLRYSLVKPLGDNGEYLEMSTKRIITPMSNTTQDVEDWTSTENPPTNHVEDDVNQDNVKDNRSNVEKAKDVSKMAELIYKFRNPEGASIFSRGDAQKQVETIKAKQNKKQYIPFLMNVMQKNGVDVNEDNVLEKFNEFC